MRPTIPKRRRCAATGAATTPSYTTTPPRSPARAPPRSTVSPKCGREQCAARAFQRHCITWRKSSRQTSWSSPPPRDTGSRGAPARSIAERVAHRSPCSVAVVPPNAGEPRFERIGVAVDGTPAARTALEFACLLADRAGGESPNLRLMHASPVPTVIGRVPSRDCRRRTQSRSSTAASWRRSPPMRASTARWRSSSTPARRPRSWCGWAKGLDVLVPGSRDHGAVKRLLLESVSTHIVRHATCPVIVVPTVTGITSGWTPDSARMVGA